MFGLMNRNLSKKNGERKGESRPNRERHGVCVRACACVCVRVRLCVLPCASAQAAGGKPSPEVAGSNHTSIRGAWPPPIPASIVMTSLDGNLLVAVLGVVRGRDKVKPIGRRAHFRTAV